MDTSKLENKIERNRDYKKSPAALQKFKSLVGNEYLAIGSSTDGATEFLMNDNADEGKSIRCFSNINENFYSLESINLGGDGLIEGYTKYIGYCKNPQNITNNLSPALRVDIGGRNHNSNRITNKYFTNDEPTPHIHFCRLNANQNKVEENALTFDHLMGYLKDLAEIKNDKGELVNGEPEEDIFENSYGMPYLAFREKFKQEYKENWQSKFKVVINDMIKKLEKCNELTAALENTRNKLANEGKTTTEINSSKEIISMKYELFENIAEVTFQSNLENYCKEKILDLNMDKSAQRI